MDEVKPCVKCGATERYKNGCCKPCGKERTTKWRQVNSERDKLNMREWHNNNAERRKAERACRVYNITLEEYYRLMTVDRCELCGDVETSVTRYGVVRRLAIDHCHLTGRVRGLLCHSCNTALGFYERDKIRHSLFEEFIAKGRTA